MQPVVELAQRSRIGVAPARVRDPSRPQRVVHGDDAAAAHELQAGFVVVQVVRLVGVNEDEVERTFQLVQGFKGRTDPKVDFLTSMYLTKAYK